MWVIIYIILGYWSVGQTIYKNKIIYTTPFNWFCTKLAYGTFLGIILIPWALINLILDR